jgi:hypothetical protein
MEHHVMNLNYRLSILIDEEYVQPDQVNQSIEDVYFFERWLNILWEGRRKRLLKDIDQNSISIELQYQSAVKGLKMADTAKQYTDLELETYMKQFFGFVIRPIKTPKQIRHEKNR